MKAALEGITEAQIKKVWFEASQIGLKTEVVYDVVETLTGKKKLHDLTKKEGILLIDLIIENGRERNSRHGMASSRQLWKIEQLRKELDWQPEQMKGFIKKYHHVEHMNWLSAESASAIINALVNMVEKKSKNKESEDINNENSVNQ